VRLRQRGREGLEDAQLSLERAPAVHVFLVFARPVERLAFADLQPVEVDAVPPVELEVAFGEIVANDADQSHGREKARRDRRVTGRSAQQARVFGLWGLDGIQSG